MDPNQPNVVPVEAYQQLANVVQQLQHQLGQMQNTQQQLQQQLEQHQQQPPPQVVVPIPAPAPSPLAFVQPTKPDTFNGDKRTKADVWLFELENYFAATNLQDPHRVPFAVSQFRDAAVTWWKHYTDALDNADPPSPVRTTWNEFKKVFLETYRPIEASETARATLHAIRQTGSVAGYIDTFLKHLNYVDNMAMEDQIFLFKRGLSYQLAKEIGMHHPKTLTEAMNYAQRAEVENRMLQGNRHSTSSAPGKGSSGHFQHGRRNNHFGHQGRTFFTQPNRISISQSAVPMELGKMEEQVHDDVSNGCEEVNDNYANDDYQHEQLNAVFSAGNKSNVTVRTNRTFVPGVSRQEFERCYKAGLCLVCKQRGHVARNCPNLSSRPTSNTTSKNQ